MGQGIDWAKLRCLVARLYILLRTGSSNVYYIRFFGLEYAGKPLRVAHIHPRG